ncbi:CoA transferase [Paraburkholderia sp. J12]|uniref:CaiB/BaiF CoA transferase family protein n=1 Tax=Paraburkholderia sp. J12 TaxID=2805432 RepID=UPI002ABE0B7E|nr:CoA transferase [Paraburkholderia sp. J12]
MTQSNQGPLAGVRILDLTSVVLGPLATLTLAELGADVIKIEAPEGDNARNAGVTKHAGMGHVFLHNNRGKKSVVLDLKHPQGRDALLRLAANADVLITNVRAAAMKRLSLDYAALAEVNKRIIYVSASGYDSRGPYADLPAYDELIQGATGIPWLMQQYGATEPSYTPITLVDRLTAYHVVYAVNGALFAREKTGLGQQVEVSMFESAAHFILADHMAGRTFEPEQGPVGYDRLLYRRPFRTSDGYLCVLIYNDRHWREFFRLVGHPEQFEQDPRFSSQQARSRNIREVYGWIAGIMPTRTTTEWQALLDEAGIPHQTVRSLDDLLVDPHLRATGFISEEEHPTEGRMLSLGMPTTWSGTPPGKTAPAPRLGEHSAEVLREAGYSDADIEDLDRLGVTRIARQP